MKIPCNVCDELYPRVQLYRVGARLMCRRCYLRMEPEPRAAEPSALALTHEEKRSLTRLDTGLAVAALCGKVGFFALIFHWAGTSAGGAGVLDGLVLAEMFTWVALTFADMPFRGVQLSTGLVFQTGLALYYFNFDCPIPADGGSERLAMAFLAFFGYTIVKVGIWGMETVLEQTGITEST